METGNAPARDVSARSSPSPGTPSLDAARRRAHMPPGTARILDRRTLESGFPRLAELLSPGMRVLDVGCGTGAITQGIAQRVQPGGRALGVDTNERLIEEARRTHAGVPGLEFLRADAYELPFHRAFDLVAAARLLQWLDEPERALASMGRALVSGGTLAVLDYNHEKIEWRPAPPESARRFYQAFLRWRADAKMDNRIADRLAGMLCGAGFRGVRVTEQHEEARRGDPDFPAKAGIWAEVAASRGRQMVADGYVTEEERSAAEQAFRLWAEEVGEYQRLYLLAAEGTAP